MIRYLCGAGVCLLVGVLLLSSQMPGEAQGKKDDLAKQIAQLKKTLAERELHIQKTDAQLTKVRGDYDAYKTKNPGNSTLQKNLDKANQAIKDKDAQIASLQQNSATTK